MASSGLGYFLGLPLRRGPAGADTDFVTGTESGFLGRSRRWSRTVLDEEARAGEGSMVRDGDKYVTTLLGVRFGLVTSSISKSINGGLLNKSMTGRQSQKK